VHPLQLENVSSPIAIIFLPKLFIPGFIFSPANIAIFTEHEIFGRLETRRGTAKRKMFKALHRGNFQQLKRGDFVLVHQDLWHSVDLRDCIR